MFLKQHGLSLVQFRDVGREGGGLFITPTNPILGNVLDPNIKKKQYLILHDCILFLYFLHECILGFLQNCIIIFLHAFTINNYYPSYIEVPIIFVHSH